MRNKSDKVVLELSFLDIVIMFLLLMLDSGDTYIMRRIAAVCLSTSLHHGSAHAIFHTNKTIPNTYIFRHEGWMSICKCNMYVYASPLFLLFDGCARLIDNYKGAVSQDLWALF